MAEASSTKPSGAVDVGGAVRQGEELDIAAVDAWLKAQVPDLRGAPEITQYSGGASNWTYRLKYPDRDLILRRPPAGTKAASAHDMMREYRIQHTLKPVYPTVPTMVAACDDHAVLGCDFYVMERLEGIIPRANLPRDVKLDATQVRRLCTNVLDELIALHKADYKKAGLETLYKGAGFCKRQVGGWDQRYEKVVTWNVPSFRKVRRWLKANCPDDSGACMIHNDWRFDNVVLDPQDPTKVIGVLDWELATVGDPLIDLGSMLAYWIEPNDNLVMRSMRRQPTHLPGMLTREEVVRYYFDKTGFSRDHWAFYEVFGLFRLAGIAQQIYYRYHHKQTDNPAFKNFWIVVHALHWRCLQLMRKAV